MSSSVALIIFLIGQPKLNAYGCNQVADALTDVVAHNFLKENRPSKDLHEIRDWVEGCRSKWKSTKKEK